MPPVKFDFNLSPDEAIEYLKNKGFKLSFDYDELKGAAHHKAFTVAKVTRLDLLNDIYTALGDSLKDGRTFEDFKKDIKPTLQKKGWWGEKEIINPGTGEVKTVKIGSRRLETIFETNMRVAYQVGRHKQMSSLPLSVYWRYKSALLENTREKHAAMHSIVKHRDDPWWKTNYPPNGWFCKCKVTAHSQRDLDKNGWDISKSKTEDIASRDWAYDVGAGSKISKLSKIDLDSSLAALPTVLSVKKDAYADLSDDELKDKFYNSLSIAVGDTFIDKINDPMIIDDSLFTTIHGYSKIKKQDRHLFIDEIANTIAEPDEIYITYDEKHQRLIKKMFKYYKGEKDSKRAMQVAFEYLEDKTQGVTAYFVKGSSQVENRRHEKLIYQREGQE